jgi:two-component system, LytTR family, sensor kinase
MAFGFWTLIVLAYSTRGEVRAGANVWVPIPWVQAFKAAVVQWYTWGVLSFAIYWLNQRLPVAPDALVRRILLHLPFSIAFTVAYTYLRWWASLLLDVPDNPHYIGANVVETTAHVMYRVGTFVYWAIAMVCVALEYQNDLKDRQIRTGALERLLSEARLAALRSQLDPHFLFNTLNSISAYVERAPRQARLMLEQLGDLMQMSLEHANRQEIALNRELAFFDRYIQLHLVRFDENLSVDVDVDPTVLRAAVPTFLLQPLTENAIRHGTSKLATRGSIKLAVWRSGDMLHVRLSDNGPGLPRGWSLRRSGVGLSNTLARLEHLYGSNRYSFAVGPGDDGGTRVDVALPYHVA